MSRWSNDFENHAIHETLRQSAEWLETEVKETDVEFEEERRRLKKVMASVQEVVSGLDPEFFPQQALDQINQHLRHQSFFQQLQVYSQTPQLGHLQTANNHITQYAQQIYNLAAMARPVAARKVIKQAEDAFASFTSSMERTAKSSSNRFQESEEALSTLDVRAGELKQQLELLGSTADEKLSEWQADFTEMQTTRAEEHSEAQIARDTKFSGLLSDWKKAVEEHSTKLYDMQSGKLDAMFDHYTKTGEAVLKDVNEKHQAVLEIHKLVGRDSVAGGYQKSAGEEQEAANRWRVISMVSLIAAIIWLGLKYWMGFEQTASGKLNWAEIITATSLTAIFLVTAGYASRQSKLHRDNEKQMRSYALETKALDPFIASLDETDQKAIKAELVRRMFGQQHMHASEKTTKIDEGTMKTLAESVSETVTRAVGKVIDKS